MGCRSSAIDDKRHADRQAAMDLKGALTRRSLAAGVGRQLGRAMSGAGRNANPHRAATGADQPRLAYLGAWTSSVSLDLAFRRLYSTGQGPRD